MTAPQPHPPVTHAFLRGVFVAMDSLGISGDANRGLTMTMVLGGIYLHREAPELADAVYADLGSSWEHSPTFDGNTEPHVLEPLLRIMQRAAERS